MPAKSKPAASAKKSKASKRNSKSKDTGEQPEFWRVTVKLEEEGMPAWMGRWKMYQIAVDPSENGMVLSRTEVLKRSGVKKSVGVEMQDPESKTDKFDERTDWIEFPEELPIEKKTLSPLPIIITVAATDVDDEISDEEPAQKRRKLGGDDDVTQVNFDKMIQFMDARDEEEERRSAAVASNPFDKMVKFMAAMQQQAPDQKSPSPNGKKRRTKRTVPIAELKAFHDNVSAAIGPNGKNPSKTAALNMSCVQAGIGVSTAWKWFETVEALERKGIDMTLKKVISKTATRDVLEKMLKKTNPVLNRYW